MPKFLLLWPCHSVRFCFWVCLSLFVGCISHPRIETMLHESPEGKVFLKEFSDPSFQASHPTTLHPKLVEEVLAGMQIQEQKTFLESALTNKAQLVPVFTYSELRFLAPLLTSGLELATPGEAVHFSLDSSVSGRTFDIVGLLFVSHQHLTFSLYQYGLATARPSLSRPSRSFDRPKRWVMTYIPSTVVVPVTTEQSGNDFIPGQVSLVINLEYLNRYLDSKKSDFRRTDSTAPNQGNPGTIHSPKHHHMNESMEEEIRRLRQSMQEQHEKLERLEHQWREDSPVPKIVLFCLWVARMLSVETTIFDDLQFIPPRITWIEPIRGS